MDLVKAGMLGAPNVCFICETFPPEGSSLVDTQRDHEYGNFRPLSGRKYVCESCVNELARVLGLSDGVRERVALETVDKYDRAYYELKWELKEFAARLEALVNRPLTSFTDTEKVEPEGMPELVLETSVVEYEPIGEIQRDSGVGQDSFEVEGEVHVSRGAGPNEPEVEVAV